MPVSVVKGLELDGVVVVEPARDRRDEEQQGLRALYVALTRARSASRSSTPPTCRRRSSPDAGEV